LAFAASWAFLQVSWTRRWTSEANLVPHRLQPKSRVQRPIAWARVSASCADSLARLPAS